MPQRGQQARSRSCSASRRRPRRSSPAPQPRRDDGQIWRRRQDANVFITFDAANRHTMQGRAACTELKQTRLKHSCSKGETYKAIQFTAGEACQKITCTSVQPRLRSTSTVRWFHALGCSLDIHCRATSAEILIIDAHMASFPFRHEPLIDLEAVNRQRDKIDQDEWLASR